MKCSWLYAAAVSAAIAFPAVTRAVPWTEVGDAGQLLATANQVTVPSPSIIFGNVATATDADLFALRLTSGVLFSATSASFGGLADIADTQLFLFDATGHGIRYNDDIDVINFYSSISFTPATTGVYYLGISAVGFNPRDGGSGGFIYVSDPFDPTATPGASQFGPLASWAADGRGVTDLGDYRINLVGAAPVPEPSSVVLMALGLAGLLAGRRWIARK